MKNFFRSRTIQAALIGGFFIIIGLMVQFRNSLFNANKNYTKAGDYNTFYGNVPGGTYGNGNTIVGSTDTNGNTILSPSLSAAIGYNAHAGSNSLSVGAFADSGSSPSSTIETYVNTKHGYSFDYPQDYEIYQINNTDYGNELPSTPATANSEQIELSKAEGIWMSIKVTVDEPQLTEASINSMYAIAPIITSTQIAGLSGYKVTWTLDKKISYDGYFVEKTNKQLYYIQISHIGIDSLENVLKTLKFF